MLELIRPLVQARTVILTGSAARSRRMAQFLAEAGARPVLLDPGRLPTDTRARFAACERQLSDPPSAFRRRLDTEDPGGTALIYAGSFTAVSEVCGRRVVGSRSTGHLAAERKDRQLELTGSGGQIINLSDGLADLRPPVVVQGLPNDGIAMATSHTYLVPSSASNNRKQRLAVKLLTDCTRAVITEFSSGLPCTFYGFISADAVMDLSPVEALVYWDQRTWRVHAPGILWPLQLSDDLLKGARSAVSSVARRLHHQLNYVGAFGTDGVITNDGYVIHEINPRVCAGFSLLDQLVPEAAPLAAFDLALRELQQASTALTAALTDVQSSLRQRTVPAFRLWEAADQPWPPPEPAARDEWAQRIRMNAARGRRPISTSMNTCRLAPLSTTWGPDRLSARMRNRRDGRCGSWLARWGRLSPFQWVPRVRTGRQ